MKTGMLSPATARTAAACLLWGVLWAVPVVPWAQVAAPALAASSSQPERSLEGWLQRLADAPRHRAYQGTLVVSSANGGWNSAHIWHVCNGEQQFERVDSLTGAPRQSFRHDDQVLTLWPQTRLARLDRLGVVSQFPEMVQPGNHRIPEFYSLKVQGVGRVAGFDTDVLLLGARDGLRYSYRVWSERKTGLVLKLQTLDGRGQVLEQSAFSELQLDPPLKPEQLAHQMTQLEGYRLEKTQQIKTDPASEGWVLKTVVPGFRTQSCFKRLPAGPHGGALHWVLSDGLATLSLFIETFDPRLHSQEGPATLGATQVLTQRLKDASGGSWWLTLVGEVPLETLQAVAQGLERRK